VSACSIDASMDNKPAHGPKRLRQSASASSMIAQSWAVASMVRRNVALGKVGNANMISPSRHRDS
jgi:hypothetical protein